MSELSKVYGSASNFVDGLGGRSGMGCDVGNTALFLTSSLSGVIEDVIAGKEYNVEVRTGWAGDLLRIDLLCGVEGGPLEVYRNGVLVGSVTGVAGQIESASLNVSVLVGDRLSLIPQPDQMPAEDWAFSIELRSQLRRRVV